MNECVCACARMHLRVCMCVQERLSHLHSFCLSSHSSPCFSISFLFLKISFSVVLSWVPSHFYLRRLIKTTLTEVTSNQCVNNSSCLLFSAVLVVPGCVDKIYHSLLPHFAIPPDACPFCISLVGSHLVVSCSTLLLSLDHSFFPHLVSLEGFISTQNLTTTLHFPLSQPSLWCKSYSFLNYKERPSFTLVSICWVNWPHFKVNTTEMFSQLFMCPCLFPLSNLYSGLSQALGFSTKFFLHYLMQCPNVFIQPSFPLASSHNPHRNISTAKLCFSIFKPRHLLSYSPLRFRIYLEIQRCSLTEHNWSNLGSTEFNEKSC